MCGGTLYVPLDDGGGVCLRGEVHRGRGDGDYEEHEQQQEHAPRGRVGRSVTAASNVTRVY